MQIQLIAPTTSTTTTDHGSARAVPAPPTIPVGVPVELRSRFDDRWTHGFSIAVCGDRAYQVRRASDGQVLPAWFPAEMLRPLLED